MFRAPIYSVSSPDGAGMLVLTLLTHSLLIAPPHYRPDRPEKQVASGSSRPDFQKSSMPTFIPVIWATLVYIWSQVQAAALSHSRSGRYLMLYLSLAH